MKQTELTEDEENLLRRIHAAHLDHDHYLKCLQELDLNEQRAYVKWPTHHIIWRGSYDVWSCDQDRIDSIEIPKARMEAAQGAGLIVSEEKECPKVLGTHVSPIRTVWSLTELGNLLLKKSLES